MCQALFQVLKITAVNKTDQNFHPQEAYSTAWCKT